MFAVSVAAVVALLLDLPVVVPLLLFLGAVVTGGYVVGSGTSPFVISARVQRQGLLPSGGPAAPSVHVEFEVQWHKGYIVETFDCWPV
jgi:hypothetical protein